MSEFDEYVTDYAENSNNYNIDIKDKYYQAIVSAYEGGTSYYDEYIKQFHVWKESEKLTATNDKTVIFEKKTTMILSKVGENQIS